MILGSALSMHKCMTYFNCYNVCDIFILSVVITNVFLILKKILMVAWVSILITHDVFFVIFGVVCIWNLANALIHVFKPLLIYFYKWALHLIL